MGQEALASLTTKTLTAWSVHPLWRPRCPTPSVSGPCASWPALGVEVEVRTTPPTPRPLAGPCPPAPAPSSHWKFRSRRSLAFWNASLSMVPAGARCLPGWRTCSDPPGHAPPGPNPRKAPRMGIGLLESLRFQNANSFKNSVHVYYLQRSPKPL